MLGIDLHRAAGLFNFDADGLVVISGRPALLPLTTIEHQLTTADSGHRFDAATGILPSTC
jgi:hypothetical protein